MNIKITKNQEFSSADREYFERNFGQLTEGGRYIIAILTNMVFTVKDMARC
jgi:hypothetical protein